MMYQASGLRAVTRSKSTPCRRRTHHWHGSQLAGGTVGTSQVAWKVRGDTLGCGCDISVQWHCPGSLCCPRCLHWRWPYALLEEWERFPKNRWEDIAVPVPDPGVSHYHKARLLQQHGWVPACLTESELGEKGVQAVLSDLGHEGLFTGRPLGGPWDLPLFYAEAAVPATDFYLDSYIVWKGNPSSRSHQALTRIKLFKCTGYIVFGTYGTERRFDFYSWFHKEPFL